MRLSRSTHLLMLLSLEALTSIIRTGLPVKLVNFFIVFFISNDLTQMVDVPTRIPDCDAHSPALLDLFISSNASICSTMAFSRLGIFDHVVVSVSIDFPSNSQQDVSLHWIAYDYSRAVWDVLHDHLRDVLWEDVFKLCASASEFCELV